MIFGKRSDKIDMVKQRPYYWKYACHPSWRHKRPLKTLRIFVPWDRGMGSKRPVSPGPMTAFCSPVTQALSHRSDTTSIMGWGQRKT
ncbi:hypothetical protein ACKLNR_010154 [Fusarium oxysporum f. sp. zingiberi]